MGAWVLKWRYRYTILALCSTVFAFYHGARQVLPPALPLMKDQLGLNYAQSGFLGAAYDIGYGTTLIAAGFLADRTRKVPMIFIGLLLLSASLILTTFSNSFESIAAARILSGASFGAYFGAGISIVSWYFPVEERGKALGIHMGFGAGSGKLFVPLLAGLLLPSLGWHPLYFALGLPVLLIALIFWRVVKEPEITAHATMPFSAIFREVFFNRIFIVLGLCKALTVSASMSLYSFLPLYLVKVMGIDLSYGGFAVAFLNGISIPVVPMAGALSDKFGRKGMIVTISALSAVALAVFPMLSGEVQVFLGVLMMGLTIGTAFPIIVSYVVDEAPSSCRSLALGYTNTFAIIGGSGATIASGYVSDAFGVQRVFPFLAVLSVVAALLALVATRSRTVEVIEQARS